MSEEYSHATNLDEMEGISIKQVEVKGRQILLARVNGNFYAIDDICTHAGCYLSEGYLEGKVINCPCHGGQFDVRSGEVLDGPPADPERSYEIKVQDGRILIKI